MKKFMTVALATAMTAAFTCTAFAVGDVDYNGMGGEDSYGAYFNPGQYVDDMTAVATVELTFDDLPEALNGCYEVSGNFDAWAWDSVNLSDDNTDGYTVIIPTSFTEDDKDDTGYGFAKVQVQNWVDGTKITLESFVLKDKDGNVLYDSAAASSGDATPIIYLAAIVGIAGIAMVASKKRA
ncbi:MAG: hypothetical protein IKN24_03325 [Lachnospiraceae bacterium]|nr:hypothetical protein [Lachnospiraceae bacterium]